MMESKASLCRSQKADCTVDKNENIDEAVDNDVKPLIGEREKITSPIKDSIVRKSNRPRKTPVHLSDAITDANAVGQSIQRRLMKTPMGRPRKQKKSSGNSTSKPKQHSQLLNLYQNFKCDHCGSRYVVNPMRRGNKISMSKYKAAPRHKIDPETHNMLTLCNACGLKFGRQKKTKRKEEISIEDQKKFIEEGERFAKELGLKLENPAETANVEEILSRGKELLELLTKATELKKLKCYDVPSLDDKSIKKNFIKVGLGNGHRKSKIFEDFVLSERTYLRDQLKFCEKGTQKILSYSNNFLHKRMKTDPEKGVRIERQKGKAALGMLRSIQDLPLEACCVDNCVRMALTHGRLLEVWRERATSSQIEARRVLAEMLTPSGGNRANCYRFVSWVTGCSNTTIGKVNDQMKNTGGDREPPEHGLKKYRKENPVVKKQRPHQTTYVPSYQILQTAANSAGLSTMMQDINEKEVEPTLKKSKRSSKPKTEQKSKKMPTYTRLPINIVTDTSEHATSVQNISAAVLSLNGNYQNSGFISIPAGITTANTISIPNGVSLQTAQQQLQQQQLQLQIQLLQQQIHNNQAANVTQHTNEASEYVVAVTHPIEQSVQHVGTPVVVQSVAAQPIVHNVVTQAINAAQSEGVLSTLVTNSAGGLNFVSASGNVGVVQQQSENRESTRTNLSLLASPNTGEIGILTETNAVNVLTPQTENCRRPTRSIESFRQVHLITSRSPTMAISQPVAISLRNPTIQNLPTMLFAQSSTSEQAQQLIVQQTANHQTSEHLIIQRPLLSQSSSDHLVVHQPSVQSISEHSTVLPPMTSFNADAFLTGDGSMTYAVINNGTISHIQQRVVESENSPTSMQFLQS